jgi:hypothetical protein
MDSMKIGFHLPAAALQLPDARRLAGCYIRRSTIKPSPIQLSDRVVRWLFKRQHRWGKRKRE